MRFINFKILLIGLIFINCTDSNTANKSSISTNIQLQNRNKIKQTNPKKANNVPNDFPSNYVVDEWYPSAFKGRYVFYENHKFVFIHGGIGKAKKFEIGKWSSDGKNILIKINKIVGLRPIGKPLNPEMSGAANPENYFRYKEYINFENWINKTQKIKISDFLWDECYINKELKASDIKFDINKYKINGKYKFASCRKLNEADLKEYSKKDLRLIRNEIFARYGYIFKNQDLKKYFETKKWYKPSHKNVDKYLTEIEKYNIELIKKCERNQ